MKLLKGKQIGGISISLGVLSLLYFLVAIDNKIDFSIFFVVVGIILITYGLFKIFIKEEIMLKKAAWLVYIFRAGIALLVISFIIVESFIIFNGTKKDSENADYVVILGAMVRGETPSLILRERLEASLNYIKEHNEIKVILSGGQGPGEKISEAEAMKRYLMQKGIEEERLIKEDKSTSTMENLQFTNNKIKEIDDGKKVKLMVVTNDFHMFRARFLTERNNFKFMGISADTKLALKPAFYIREYFAVIKSLIMDK